MRQAKNCLIRQLKFASACDLPFRRKPAMKRLLVPYAIFTAAILSEHPAQAQTALTVYTAFEAEDLQRYKEAFETAHPDITINWVRDSTGVVTAKLLAEKDN